MTKVLNLDALDTNVERSIIVKGKTYMMQPFSVEDFINQMKEIEQIGDKEPSGSEMYETSLRMILRAFPTLDDATLRSLNTFQVDAIYNFLRAKGEEEVEEAVASGN